MTCQQDGFYLKAELLLYRRSYALSSVLHACHGGSFDTCPQITEQCIDRTGVLLQPLFNI